MLDPKGGGKEGGGGGGVARMDSGEAIFCH